jgi:hypothetical protein
MEAALSHGLERVIHTGSVATPALHLGNRQRRNSMR